MFGTEIHRVTFIITFLQVLILPACILHLTLKKRDQSRRNIVYLTVIFILYNLFSGLFPDPTLSIPIAIQLVLAYTIGAIMSVYFVIYIYHEFGITPILFFNLRFMIPIVSTSFILGFLTTYLLTGNLRLAKTLFLIVPLFLMALFVFRAFKELISISIRRNKEKHFIYRMYSAYVGLFSVFIMMIIVMIGDFQVVEQSVCNFGYFVIMLSYYNSLLYAYKNDIFQRSELIEQFNELGFTNREKQIGEMLISGIEDYKKISEILFISYNGVTSHTSNIFKKANVKSKKEFISRFYK
ncbi:LuxR C-terminal-related transcriptional regulator [Tenacibaculum sp. C7A-26P2]|uniref:LuxR C-terminal-related transcriptional regulator n=1 Tax=Tenacibaculum sp. C7A-26P2 TaxID=3447504 RepID=UPI003F87C70E